MEAYTSFAQVYDELMDNVPYGEWCVYLCAILKSYGIEDGILLDLGCGTGTLTEMLSDEGFDMIGIDGSEDMLSIAMEKRAQGGYDQILYLLQDMREFELYGTVRGVVSVCDSMNYMTDPEDFLTVLKLVHNYLDYDGIFIFDLNTEYKYANLLGDQTFAENRPDCSFIWENTYDEESRINEYALTLYVQEEELFRRFQEFHYQRAYSLTEVKDLIAKSGLVLEQMIEVPEVGEPFEFSPVKGTTERVYFVARKPKN